MTTKFLLSVILILCIGIVCTENALADTSPVGTIVFSDPIQASADETNQTYPNGTWRITSDIRWSDHTGVSGQIRNLMKDFKYQSGTGR